jgi:DNA polymerase-3 subunit gamma/tau
VSLSEVADRLELIAESENVSIDRAALELIAREGTGSVRDSISLLDQLLADPDMHISLELAEQTLGTASGQNVIELVQALVESNAAWGLDIINGAVDGGADPRQFGRQVIEHLRRMLLVKMGGDELVDMTEDRRAVIQDQAGAFGRKALLAAIRAFNNAVQEWQGGWQPQLPLELAFLESIKPVVEDEPEPAPRSRVPVRTQDDLPVPVETTKTSAPPPTPAGEQIQLTDVKAHWTRVQKIARSHNPSLPALLDHVTPREIRANRLTLGVPQAVFKQKLEDKREALEAAILEVFGVQLQIHIVVVSESGVQQDQALDERLAEDDVLAYGVQELGGEITDLDE